MGIRRGHLYPGFYRGRCRWCMAPLSVSSSQRTDSAALSGRQPHRSAPTRHDLQVRPEQFWVGDWRSAVVSVQRLGSCGMECGCIRRTIPWDLELETHYVASDETRHIATRARLVAAKVQFGAAQATRTLAMTFWKSWTMRAVRTCRLISHVGWPMRES